MRLNRLKELIKVVEESNIDEIELRGPFRSVRVTKKRPQTEDQRPKTEDQRPKTILVEEKPVPVSSEPVGGVVSPAGAVSIKAPMVGTFYRSSSPSAPPYVEVGDKVAIGKVVCVIEAMKVLNEIEAESAGTIKEVFVKNGEPVEYGQSLFLLEPAFSI